MTTHRYTLDQYSGVVKKIPDLAEAAIVRALRSAAQRTKVEVVIQIDTASPFPAVDTGLLRRSVEVDNLPDGALLSVMAPYAAAVEDGSRPHMPPVAPILEWVKRKRLAGRRPSKSAGGTKMDAYERESKAIAWAIALHIKRYGTSPRHYFQKSMEKVPGFLTAALNEEFAKL